MCVCVCFRRDLLIYLRLPTDHRAMEPPADTTGDPAQGCNHNHDHSHAHAHGDAAPASAPAPAPRSLPLPKWCNSRHIKYFLTNLRGLPTPYSAADTNRMTLVFFCVSALDILGALEGDDAVLTQADKDRIIDWIYANQVSRLRDKHTCCMTCTLSSRWNENEHENVFGACVQVVVPASGEFRSHAGFIGGTFMGTPFRPAASSSSRSNADGGDGDGGGGGGGEASAADAAEDGADSVATGGCVASPHVFAHIAMTYTALATLAVLGDDFSRVRRDDVL